MLHPIYRVQAFEHVGPYTVRIAFDDYTEQVVDFRPVLAGELYGPLRDPAVFLQACLDPEAGTLTWPNGADFDPAVLHDWPEVSSELALRAAAWDKAIA
jgi:uncharacterized protein DUF2442